MDILGFFFIFVLVFILTSLFVSAAAVTDIKNKFGSYTEKELELKTKRFTVYPLVFMGITAVLWPVMACLNILAVDIILALPLVVCLFASATFLFPVSIYGIILASALKKTQEKKYLKSSYKLCGIISSAVSLVLLVVFFRVLAELL